MSTTRRVRTIDLERPLNPELTGICEVILVRHGQQLLSAETTVEEFVDPPLGDLGLQQADAVGRRLADEAISTVYASPLRRARTTADAIAGHHRLTVIEVPDLVEYDAWSQLPAGSNLASALSPDEHRAIVREAGRTKMLSQFRFGEDVAAFHTRVDAALSAIIDRHAGSRVVVVCHNAVINSLIRLPMRTTVDMPFRLHHTSLTVVRGAGEQRAVISVNDFTHVKPFQDSIGAHNL